jgi:hypothetical protein
MAENLKVSQCSRQLCGEVPGRVGAGIGPAVCQDLFSGKQSSRLPAAVHGGHGSAGGCLPRGTGLLGKMGAPRCELGPIVAQMFLSVKCGRLRVLGRLWFQPQDPARLDHGIQKTPGHGPGSSRGKDTTTKFPTAGVQGTRKDLLTRHTHLPHGNALLVEVTQSFAQPGFL